MDDRPGLCHDDVLHHRQPQRSSRTAPAWRLVLRRWAYLSFPGRTATHGAGQYRLAASRRRDGNGRRWTDVSPRKPQARLPLPRPKQTSCDLPQVKHMQGVAGTVIMYTGTTTHGVRSWRNPHRERRFVNTKAGPNIGGRSAKHKVSDLDGRPKNESGRHFSVRSVFHRDKKTQEALWMGWFSVAKSL